LIPRHYYLGFADRLQVAIATLIPRHYYLGFADRLQVAIADGNLNTLRAMESVARHRVQQFERWLPDWPALIDSWQHDHAAAEEAVLAARQTIRRLPWP
jgi:hypothetical protein